MNELIIGRAGPRDPQRIPLATKLGTDIRNSRRRELDPAVMKARFKELKKTYSGLTPRSLSNEYNCFGMVFANRRTCIDETEVEKILMEDDYQLVHDRTKVFLGDVILYRSSKTGEICHAGVVVAINESSSAGSSGLWFLILSQWGGMGEYLHHERTVTEAMGHNREFRSERQGI